MEISGKFRLFLKECLDKDENLTQVEISRRTGISKTLLNDYLNERKPLSESKRELIAESLGFKYEVAIKIGREIIEGPSPAPGDLPLPNIQAEISSKAVAEKIQALTQTDLKLVNDLVNRLSKSGTQGDPV